jgi:hypothetical protein
MAAKPKSEVNPEDIPVVSMANRYCDKKLTQKKLDSVKHSKKHDLFRAAFMETFRSCFPDCHRPICQSAVGQDSDTVYSIDFVLLIPA